MIIPKSNTVRPEPGKENWNWHKSLETQLPGRAGFKYGTILSNGQVSSKTGQKAMHSLHRALLPSVHLPGRKPGAVVFCRPRVVGSLYSWGLKVVCNLVVKKMCFCVFLSAFNCDIIHFQKTLDSYRNSIQSLNFESV